MQDAWQRTRELIGENAVDKLYNAHVIVFGCGGVGGFAIEALVRSGIGSLTVIDYDHVEISNLNRQIIADMHKIGQLKVELVKERVCEINPSLKFFSYPIRYGEDQLIDLSPYDFVIDAMDDIQAKVVLMRESQKLDIPLVMALGTARRLDPSQLYWTDLLSVTDDPLARKLKALVKKAQLKTVPVLSSNERSRPTKLNPDLQRVVLGSMIFVPASAGLALAQRVMQQIIKDAL